MRSAGNRVLMIKFRARDEEKAWLADLAESRGLTSSDWLRLAIRDAHQKLARKSELESK